MNEALAKANVDHERVKLEHDRMLAEINDATLPSLGLTSTKMKRVMQKIEQVAPTDISVLITGEAGTGKEIIARTVHLLSPRSKNRFIVVKCSDLPAELIESELFGYPKGAFTGTYRDRIGRFEAAEGGTIFLDEIGDLPLLLQSRLQRVLKEGVYTPVGESGHRPVDVRVIAATDKNLRALIEDGKFRSDLYYQLSLFSIESIPLRDRPEDIGKLIDHFIRKFNRKFKKNISGLDDTTLLRLQTYAYPGNLWELESMVERAFIGTSNGVLPIQVPPDGNPGPTLNVFDGRLTEFLPFEEYQRKYIQLVLDSTGGKVSGEGGAAEILQIHPQTLFSKMKRLGIKR